jgi:hypothetical protein
VSFDEDYEDICSEPFVYHVDVRALLTAEVSWYRIMLWLAMHPNVTQTQNFAAFCTTLEFPSRELKLEFFMTFPGVLKGEE